MCLLSFTIMSYDPLNAWFLIPLKKVVLFLDIGVADYIHSLPEVTNVYPVVPQLC